MPERIQRKRTKGWRMPEGVVYVGRPTRYGNPFKAGDTFGYAPHCGYVVKDNTEAVAFFRWWVDKGLGGWDYEHLARLDLAGKDLACWCPLDQPCHADVLLEIANG